MSDDNDEHGLKRTQRNDLYLKTGPFYIFANCTWQSWQIEEIEDYLNKLLTQANSMKCQLRNTNLYCHTVSVRGQKPFQRHSPGQ